MRRYKYPTINTDTYTLNEVDGRLERGEEERRDGRERRGGKDQEEKMERKGEDGWGGRGKERREKRKIDWGRKGGEEYSIRYNV